MNNSQSSCNKDSGRTERPAISNYLSVCILSLFDDALDREMQNITDKVNRVVTEQKPPYCSKNSYLIDIEGYVRIRHLKDEFTQFIVSCAGS